MLLARMMVPPSDSSSNCLIATDNTTVVAYINEEGSLRSGSLCALLWLLLSWCNLRKIELKARHITGHLNAIADKLPCEDQVIHLQEVFDQICRKRQGPKVDLFIFTFFDLLFTMRYNNKLPKFVSPVSEPKAWLVDALTVSW